MSVEEIKQAVVGAVETKLEGKASVESLELTQKTIENQAAQIKELEAGVNEAKNIAADVEDKMKTHQSNIRTGAKAVELQFDTKALNVALKQVLGGDKKFDFANFDSKSVTIGGSDGEVLGIEEELGRTVIERARENVAILGLIANKNVGSTDYREMVLRKYPLTDGQAEQSGNSNTAPGDIWALTGTPSYESVALTVGKQYAKPLISDEAIADPHIDLYAHLQTLLTEEMSRYWALQVLFGNGAGNNINGILAKDKRISAVESVKDNDTRHFDFYPVMLSGTEDSIGATDPTAAGSAIDNVIDLSVMLPTNYVAGAQYVMNRRTLGQYRKLKDLEGRPLIQFEAGAFNLVGHAVVIEDYMPDVDGTNSASISKVDCRYPVIFGKLNMAYALCNIDDKFLVDPYSADGGVMIKVTSRKGDIVQHNDAIVVFRTDADWV